MGSTQGTPKGVGQPVGLLVQVWSRCSVLLGLVLHSELLWSTESEGCLWHWLMLAQQLDFAGAPQSVFESSRGKAERGCNAKEVHLDPLLPAASSTVIVRKTKSGGVSKYNPNVPTRHKHFHLARQCILLKHSWEGRWTWRRAPPVHLKLPFCKPWLNLSSMHYNSFSVYFRQTEKLIVEHSVFCKLIKNIRSQQNHLIEM